MYVQSGIEYVKIRIYLYYIYIIYRDLWHALGVSRWEYQLQIVLSGYSASNSSFQFKPKLSAR